MSEKYKNIETEFSNEEVSMRDSIDRISLRQLELQNQILTITSAIQVLEVNAKQAQTPADKGKFYSLVSRNVEILNQLYSTVAQFESVRHKYQQEINKVKKDKLTMINIELRRLDEKFDSFNENEMAKFMSEMKNLVKKAQELPHFKEESKNLTTDVAYSLD